MPSQLFSASVPRIDRVDRPRHHAFLRLLAGGDPESREWLCARAGLLVLRYVDAWSSGEWLPVQLLAERAAVADAIVEIPRGDQMRGLLSAILDRTSTDWAIAANGEPFPHPPSVARVAAPLLAYAHALQFSSDWALASQVYLTVWNACGPHAVHAQAPGDLESATVAALRLGACYRMLGEVEQANAAYEAAVALAKHTGDLRTVFLARLGLAKLVQDRGNLPLADSCIASVVSEATTAQLLDIRACAFHERAVVAYHRGQYRNAIEWGFESWAIERDARERQRVLCDLAVALLAAGHRDVSRAAHQMLADDASEPLTRWAALLNLIDISTLDRDEAEYQRVRRALRSVSLPPRFAANYHYYVGIAEFTFGRALRATTELERAVSLAEEHRFGELLIKAESALLMVRNGQKAPASVPAAPLPPEFGYISDALHGAWAAASVGAD